MPAWGDPRLRPVSVTPHAAALWKEIPPPLDDNEPPRLEERPRLAGRALVTQPKAEHAADVLLTSHRFLWRPIGDHGAATEGEGWHAFSWIELRITGRRGKHALRLRHEVPYQANEEFGLFAGKTGLNAFTQWVALRNEVMYLIASWAPISQFDADLARHAVLSRLERMLEPGEKLQSDCYLADLDSRGHYKLVTVFVTSLRLLWFDGSEFYSAHLSNVSLGGESDYEGGVRLIVDVPAGREQALTFLHFVAPDARSLKASKRFIRVLSRRVGA